MTLMRYKKKSKQKNLVIQDNEVGLWASTWAPMTFLIAGRWHY